MLLPAQSCVQKTSCIFLRVEEKKNVPSLTGEKEKDFNEEKQGPMFFFFLFLKKGTEASMPNACIKEPMPIRPWHLLNNALIPLREKRYPDMRYLDLLSFIVK